MASLPFELKGKTVYVAGHRGMVGSALVRRLAAENVELLMATRGEGVEETGVDRKSGKTVVRIDPAYFRPTEVDLLVGDASKAREKLGWMPRTSFAQLVKEMVASDLQDARREVANGKPSV